MMRCGTTGSCSHILMNSVVGVRRRARKDGISLLLAWRDGRANPLLELKRAAFKHATKTKVAPIGGETPSHEHLPGGATRRRANERP